MGDDLTPCALLNEVCQCKEFKFRSKFEYKPAVQKLAVQNIIECVVNIYDKDNNVIQTNVGLSNSKKLAMQNAAFGAIKWFHESKYWPVIRENCFLKAKWNNYIARIFTSTDYQAGGLESNDAVAFLMVNLSRKTHVGEVVRAFRITNPARVLGEDFGHALSDQTLVHVNSDLAGK